MWQKIAIGLRLALELLPLVYQIIETITQDRKEQKRLLKHSVHAVSAVVATRKDDVEAQLRQKGT